MNYVEIIGPYDAVFVGPFESDAAAEAWIAQRKRTRERSEHFNFCPMTEQEMRDSIAEFGPLPTYTPAEIDKD